ncbi:MAG: metallophosphoesterase [Pelagibacteraceae bacterium]|nr:metallophosphoesterase [Pelagibacteraceae bacterium]
MSDIQIRNLKRHSEYSQVFDNLYEEVKKYPNNSVAYIGGDIAHSKTEMSPELIDMLSKLFKNLADIVPTIIIAGNHDCNLNNLSRMDCLSPIVDNLNHPNLHYLRNTGIYKCADVSFVVWDVWDKESNFIKAKDVSGDTKIILYHGTVDQSKTDIGFKLPSKVTLDTFKGYDLGLLGDIHKRQFINEKKTIGYCGSMVQQNHGEDIGKGYLLWDVPNRTSEYIELHNDYGFVTLDIDGGILPDISKLPNKSRVRMRVSNTSVADIKRISTNLRQQYPDTREITITRTDPISDTERVRGHRIDIGDITDSDFQYELIEEYLNNNFAVDNDTLLKIKDINKDLNAELPEEEVYRNIDWKIKKFEFSNMFSYGENNIIDFTNLTGTIGLFASNATGKSSLLDALSFCIYDTSSRTFKAENVLNNQKNWFDCKLNVEVNGKDYWIERYAKKQKKGNVKVNVDFYMLDDFGKKESLNGDQRRSTNNNIRRVLGNYEDFLLTTLSSQVSNIVFIDKTQKEKKELLAQFMGIGVFDKLYMLATEKIKEVTNVLKSFKETNYDEELVEIKTNKIDVKSQLKTVELKLDDKVSEESDIKNKILMLAKKLKPVDVSMDIMDLKNRREKLKDVSVDYDNQLANINTTLKQIEWDIDANTSKIDGYKKQNIESTYMELVQLEQDRTNTKIEIDKLKIEVRNKLDKTEKLVSLEYDPDCDFCMNNPFTLDAIKIKKELNDDKMLATKYVTDIDNLDAKIKRMFNVRNHKLDYDTAIEDLRQLSIQKNNNITNTGLIAEKKKNVLSQITTVQDKISKYYEQENDILYNRELNKKSNDLTDRQTILIDEIKVLNTEVRNTYGSLQVLENSRRNILNTIKKVDELESENKAYEYYLDAIKRDGVPYELISKSLPTIEREVNDILAQIVDFQIIFEMDGKNINNYIVYDDDNVWPLEMCSGMERFISSLALRVGLINVTNLPRSNFLAIDEGFGSMDSDNINSVYQLFQYLKSQFQFTLIVSHIDSMRDAVDTLLEISKINGESHVDFTQPSS